MDCIPTPQNVPAHFQSFAEGRLFLKIRRHGRIRDVRQKRAVIRGVKVRTRENVGLLVFVAGAQRRHTPTPSTA